MKYKVYMHKTKSNKMYIGITSKNNPNDRWRNGDGYHHNKYFTSAIKKYGWNNIEHIILYENLTEKEAKEKEIYLINKYKTNNRKYGYNQSSGGESSTGYKHTTEQIEKQKRNRKTPIYSEETRKKMSIASKRNWNNIEYKEKMKQIFKNRKPKYKYFLSEETKEKIKNTRKVKYIKCVETGEIFRGTRDVSEKLNVDRRTVMRILKNEYGFKSTKGYHFEYV